MVVCNQPYHQGNTILSAKIAQRDRTLVAISWRWLHFEQGGDLRACYVVRGGNESPFVLKSAMEYLRSSTPKAACAVLVNDRKKTLQPAAIYLTYQVLYTSYDQLASAELVVY